MEHIISIKSVENITHDVKRFVCEKPKGYFFIPGQATDVAIHLKGWEMEKRPFTFTSLQNAPYLEFMIKIYKEHNGVTNKLNSLRSGDELIIGDVWGAIEYKGPGCFIAGGAGITPFIAILRQLKEGNKLDGHQLLFSNKTTHDIILEAEINAMLGENVIHVITEEQTSIYHHGFINEALLKKYINDFKKHFYLCGPPKMVEALQDCLVKLGANPDAVVFEK